MIVYTVHDKVARTWSYPQVSPTEASAVRDFGLLKSRPGVPGDDLECVMIASWQSDVGDLVKVPAKVLVHAKSRRRCASGLVDGLVSDHK